MLVQDWNIGKVKRLNINLLSTWIEKARLHPYDSVYSLFYDLFNKIIYFTIVLFLNTHLQFYRYYTAINKGFFSCQIHIHDIRKLNKLFE